MTYHLARHRSSLGASPVDAFFSQQVDSLLDTAADRFSVYVDSPKGEALVNKIQDKSETIAINLLKKHKEELLLLAVSFAALTTVGVSLGGKLGTKGTSAALLVAVGALLPVIMREGGTPPARKAPKRA